MQRDMVTLKVIPFWFKFLLRSLVDAVLPHKEINYSQESNPKFSKWSSLPCKHETQSKDTMVFQMEETLLKSNSLFPYFFLVAFEAGGLLRALALFISYPFIQLFSNELAIKAMVFLCFLGMRKENLRIARSVLPKFFLEDVCSEGYEVIQMQHRKVAVSNLPSVMVESFMKEYVGVDAVLGKKLKEAFGYYVGLMEETVNTDALIKEKNSLVGFGMIRKNEKEQILDLCKEIYLVSEAEKRKWHILPREKYLKPLIFHDGRLAFRPTFFATFAMFMWIPFGFSLSVVRLILAKLLPYELSLPIMTFTGVRGIVSGLNSITLKDNKAECVSTIYVCNHRTLLDPVYISMAQMKPVQAVVYSISRVSEVMSPVRTISLMRDREKDSRTITRLLRNGDVVICPEGTTCREPYLLRFSPLFAEVSDNIVPVALDVHVSMFYGTTASGMKCLDPVFFLMNPYPLYTIKFLGRLSNSHTCPGGGKTSIQVANYVQKLIADDLGFECTSLTRKDKYMILAGNEGIVKN